MFTVKIKVKEKNPEKFAELKKRMQEVSRHDPVYRQAGRAAEYSA